MTKGLVAAIAVTLWSGGLVLAQTPAPHGNTVNTPDNAAPSTGVGTGVMSPPPSAANKETGPPIVPAPSTADAGHAAPVAGANSFTESQARSRLAENGFSNIGALKKTDQGVWQGAAMKDSQQVQVSLDYQGNIATR